MSLVEIVEHMVSEMDMASLWFQDSLDSSYQYIGSSWQETRVCMYFNCGCSHWYEFHTSTGYVWISFVRAVSVQVVFLSKPYMKWTTQNLYYF